MNGFEWNMKYVLDMGKQAQERQKSIQNLKGQNFAK